MKNSESIAKAEAILMGMTQFMDSNVEAKIVLDKLLDFFRVYKTVSVTSQDLIKEVTTLSRPGVEVRIRAIGTSRIMGEFQVLNIVLDTTEPEHIMKDITRPYGVHAYVYNLDAPDCSEYGTVVFAQDSRGIHRIA